MNLDYLAGFIDADGCFVVGQGTINVRVAQKDTEILHLIQDTFGGDFALASGETGVHNIRWYGDDAVEIAKKLKGHIIQKDAELDLLLEYAKTRGIRGRHTLPEVKDKRIELEKSMQIARKNRLKGKMVDGIFIKEKDLPQELEEIPPDATHTGTHNKYLKTDGKFWSTYVEGTWKVMSGEPIGEIIKLTD